MDFDLSVGSVGAASSVVAAWVMARYGIAAGVVAALAVGLIVGIANGLLVAKVRINPFVATLGMQTLVVGLLFVATNATPVYGGVPDVFTVVGLGRSWPGASGGPDLLRRGACHLGTAIACRARPSHLRGRRQS